MIDGCYIHMVIICVIWVGYRLDSTPLEAEPSTSSALEVYESTAFRSASLMLASMVRVRFCAAVSLTSLGVTSAT